MKSRSKALPVITDARTAAPVKPLQVLMIGPALDVKGGVSSVERLLLAALPARITTTHIASMTDGSKLTKLRVFLRGLWRSWRELARPIDIVHIHFASRASSVRKKQFARLAFASGKKVIMHAHGAEYRLYWEEMSAGARNDTLQVLRRSDALIVLGESWREFFEGIGVPPQKIVVLPNPVQVPAHLPERPARDQTHFVYLGIINQRKGAYDLLDAVTQLTSTDRQRMRLTMAGNGEGDKLRALIQQRGLGNVIAVHDWLDPTARDALLMQADAFVLPSYNEGLPMALLEAMAWGLAPICTPVGSIPEVIHNGSNGVLVQPGDIAQLTAALLQLTVNPTERLRIGALARASVEPLAIDVYTRRLCDLYDAVAQTGLPLRTAECTA